MVRLGNIRADLKRRAKRLIRLYKNNPSRKNLMALLKYIQKTGDLRNIDPNQLTVLEIDKAFRKFGIWESSNGIFDLLEADAKLRELLKRWNLEPSIESLGQLAKHLQRIGEITPGNVRNVTMGEFSDALERLGFYEALEEDIAKLSAHTAALLVRYGASEEAATKKSIALTGQIPDDEILHQAIKKFGIGVKGVHKQNPKKHWIRQGHYVFELKDPKKFGESRNSAIADVGISYYTLDETILKLLSAIATARELLEGNNNVRSTQR